MVGVVEVKRITGAILALAFLSACSSQPTLTLGSLLKEPPSTQRLRALTDADVYDMLDRQYQEWGGKSLRSQIIATVGPIALDGATVAASIAAIGGASAKAVSVWVGIWGFFARAIGLVDPVNRANAYNGGLELLFDADQKYLLALSAGRHRGVIPTGRLSAIGARLAGEILDAQKEVRKALLSIVQRQPDLQTMRAELDRLVQEIEAGELAEDEAASKKALSEKDLPQ